MAVSFWTVGALVGNATTTTLNIVAPSLAADDIMIAAVHSNDNQVVSAPDGSWTLMVDQINTANQRVRLWWKRAVAGDSGATFAFTKPTDNNLLFCGVISAWTGCITSGSPLDATSPTVTPWNVAADAVTYNSFDPTETTAYVVAIGLYNENQTTAGTIAGTDPTLTNRWDLETPAGADASIFGYSGSSSGAATGQRTQATSSVVDAISVGVLFGLVAAITPRSVAGSQPNSTGALARQFTARRDVTGSQPNPTATLTRKPIYNRAPQGNQPASSASLTAVNNGPGLIQRDVAGNQPAAVGVLARKEEAKRAVTGDQPNAVGSITRVLHANRGPVGSQVGGPASLQRQYTAYRAGTGDQPTALGTLTRSQQFLRSMAGGQPNPTGLLSRVEHARRAVAGIATAATGSLSRLASHYRAAAGDQIASVGALARQLLANRQTAGSQPSASATLSGVLVIRRSISGDQHTSTATLVRIKQAFRTVTGDQAAATATLSRKAVRHRSVAGDQPTPTARAMYLRFVYLDGKQSIATGAITRYFSGGRSLTGGQEQPWPAGSLTRKKSTKRDAAGVQRYLDQAVQIGSVRD